MQHLKILFYIKIWRSRWSLNLRRSETTEPVSVHASPWLEPLQASLLPSGEFTPDLHILCHLPCSITQVLCIVESYYFELIFLPKMVKLKEERVGDVFKKIRKSLVLL